MVNTATARSNTLYAARRNEAAGRTQSHEKAEHTVDALSVYLGELRRTGRIDADTEAALGARVQGWQRTARMIILAQPEAWRVILDEVARVEAGEHSPRYMCETGGDMGIDALRAKLTEHFEPVRALVAAPETADRTQAILEALDGVKFGRQFWCKLIKHLEAGSRWGKDPAAKRRLRRALAEQAEAEAGARVARDELVAANLRLVVAIAKRYAGPKVCFVDLVQEGNLGLMRAAEKFDPAHGVRFSTYAGSWIREAMQRLVVDAGHPLHAPREAWRNASILRRTAAELREASGENPTESELIEATGLSHETIRDLAVLDLKPLELDDEVQSVLSERCLAQPADTHAASDIELLTLRDQVAALLAHLPERERFVVAMYFGLGSDCGSSLAEVAEHLGVTRQRVQQVKKRALERLRSPKLMREVLGGIRAGNTRGTGSAGGSSSER